jgi:hypothetical protein
MSFRLPTETRSDLQKAAKANRRSITQELLHRLDESFKEDRKNYRDPAAKALCFLFSELAEYVHHGTPDWRSDPFLFRAFKLAVPTLLDNLPEPPGKIETPGLLKSILEVLSRDEPMNKTEFARGERERINRIMKSPEALAEFAAKATLVAYFKPSQRYKDWEPVRERLDARTDGFGSKLLRHQENTYYGNEQARNALSLEPRGRKS